MEYCSGGELLQKVIAQGSLTESETVHLMRKIFSAVAYLHEKGICHRDLKPENFLFSDNSIDAEIKIVDFGLSKKFSDEDNNQMTTVVGTALYVAPEVLKGSYDEKCDEWSLGVVLYVILSGNPPFYAETKREIFKKIESGRYNFEGPEWSRVSSLAKDLIKKLLVVDPKRRLSAAPVSYTHLTLPTIYSV
eukprot:TRINITY_DN6061_c0_g1_i1.p1 TRINITY_DN6061_c0_g1~~TRINITY_DN6061_c0_g1_i1.p1  ORF type:complete len:191 (-),score=41.86 TRINITY_DN6061_c0_g1_i1:34-606(-)